MSSYNQEIRTDCVLMIQTFTEPDQKDWPDKTINDLPVELLPLIFKNLMCFSDLSNCRLVSKLWKYYVERIKITELVICDSQLFTDIDDTSHWFLELDPKTIVRRMFIENISSLIKCPFKLTNVKCVHVFIIRSKQDFEILKLFPKINHLEIEFLDKKDEYTLDLMELKKLHIRGVGMARLTVNSRIESLLCHYGDYINCVYPLDVKLLQLFNWNLEITAYERYIFTFKNIECLCLRYAYSQVLKNLMQFNMLTELPNLNIIECNGVSIECSSEWESCMNQLILLRSQQGKENSLKIYYENTELIGNKSFYDYGFNLNFKSKLI